MNGSGSRPARAPRPALVALGVFLAVKAVEGPVRYILVNADLAWVAYVPTFLLLAVIVIRGLPLLYPWRLRRVILCAVIVIAGWLGLSLVGNPGQVLFGVYVWVPFLFGALLAPEIVPHLRRLHRLYALLWSVSVLGVFLDYFFDLPWSGLEYEIRGITVEGVRKWYTFGIERLAGFARASFEAAIIILVLSLLLIAYGNSRWAKFAAWVIGGGAIVLTTTKGIVAVYLALTLLLLLRRWMPVFVLRVVPYLVAAVVIALPSYSWTQTVSLNLDSEVTRFLFASFGDRLTYMWPGAYDLVFQHGAGLFGRGIGGIGAPQERFEEALYNPADNLFVYLFGIFGYFGAPLLLVIAHRVSKFAVSRKGEAGLFYLLGTGILIYGITTNVVESAYMAVFLGFVVRSASYFGADDVTRGGVGISGQSRMLAQNSNQHRGAEWS